MRYKFQHGRNFWNFSEPNRLLVKRRSRNLAHVKLTFLSGMLTSHCLYDDQKYNTDRTLAEANLAGERCQWTNQWHWTFLAIWNINHWFHVFLIVALMKLPHLPYSCPLSWFLPCVQLSYTDVKFGIKMLGSYYRRLLQWSEKLRAECRSLGLSFQSLILLHGIAPKGW